MDGIESPRSPTSPNPTDSMVTVPLSDRQSNPRDSRMFDIPETPVEERNAEDTPLDVEDESGRTPRNDTLYDPDSETRPALDASPRSPSRDTQEDPASPATSDRVDWEELEKTEEQEPRNEATDEVRREIDVTSRSVPVPELMCFSRPLCSWLASSRRTMPSSQTPNPA